MESSNLLQLIDYVRSDTPEYTTFSGVLTINKMHEGKKYMSVEEFRSTGGQPILLLKMGNGKTRVLFVGFPHPCEPFGALMLNSLYKCLISDPSLERLDITWLMIPCWNIDGMLLNKNWFAQPRSLTNYITNVYRPYCAHDPEWAFPLKYKEYSWCKPLKETEILMNVMKKYKPHLYFPLHNSFITGLHYFVSRESPQLFDQLQTIMRYSPLPISKSPFDMSNIVEFRKGIYSLYGLELIYNFLERNSVAPHKVLDHGTSSDGYFLRLTNGFSLTCEVPLFYSSISGVDSQKLMSEDARLTEKLFEYTAHVWETYQKHYSNREDAHLLLKSVEADIEEYQLHDSVDNIISERAEKPKDFNYSYHINVMDNLDVLGMLYQLFDDTDAESIRIKKEIYTYITERCRIEAELGGIKATPIKMGITIQVESYLKAIHLYMSHHL